MNVDFTSLNAGCEVGSRSEIASKFEFNPSGIDFLLFERFIDINFQKFIFVVLVGLSGILKIVFWKYFHLEIKYIEKYCLSVNYEVLQFIFDIQQISIYQSMCIIALNVN